MKFLRREEQKKGNELMAKIKQQWNQMEEKFMQSEEVFHFSFSFSSTEGGPSA